MSRYDDNGEGQERPTDEELVRLFLDGDNTAFEELVSRYESVIMNMAYRLLGNRSDAADVCQEGFSSSSSASWSFRGEAKFSLALPRVPQCLPTTTRRSRRYISISESPATTCRTSNSAWPTTASTRRREAWKGGHTENGEEAIARLPTNSKK